MQTFLPYPDFARSAACLDRQRLGRQRVEVLQLLRAILVPGSGWANHPATKMWRGYANVLAAYGVAVCREWVSRGYADSCEQKIVDISNPSTRFGPEWFGNPTFHAAHRSNLLRKDPIHYGQFGWTEPSDLPYVWPV